MHKRMVRPVVMAAIFGAAALMAGCGQEIKKENEQLKSQVATLQKENADLKNQVAAAKAENEKMKQDMETAQKEMETKMQEMQKAPPAKAPSKR